jgi:hypothetical protein
MTIKRAILYLGRKVNTDNGHMRLRLLVDDPSNTLTTDLLNDDVAVTVTDADSSWNVTQSIGGCVQRARDIHCRVSSSQRAVFRRVKNSMTQWLVRTYATHLTDAQTGPRQDGVNPIAVPIQVSFIRPMSTTTAQTSACRSIRYESLICKP